MAKKQLKETTSCLVLCEGIDAKFFLIWLLDYYKKKGKSEFNKIQIEDFGGITELQNSLNVWKNISGFSRQIKSLCVMRDAERDFRSAAQSIKNTIKQCGFCIADEMCKVEESNSFKTAFFLFPGFKDKSGNYMAGTLEDLCLNILNDSIKEAKLNSINEFIGKCQQQYHLDYPRIHKTRLHEFLVMHDKYVDAKIGEAAKIGAFDFESEVVKGIVNLFCDLIN